jgi:hypothetical protein
VREHHQRIFRLGAGDRRVLKEMQIHEEWQLEIWRRPIGHIGWVEHHQSEMAVPIEKLDLPQSNGIKLFGRRKHGNRP